MLERYAEFVVRRKWRVFLFMALLWGTMAFGLQKLEFHTNYRIWFAEDSQTIQDFDGMLDKFGSDDSALVVFRDADNGMLNNDALAAIRELTDAFWTIEGVKRVDSLANFTTVRGARLEHESPALAVNDRWIAASGDKHEIWVWRADGSERRRLTGHEGLVEHVVLDGDRLYSGSIDRTVRIWDLTTGAQMKVLGGVPGQVSALTLADGQLFAGSYRSLVAWDVTTGERSWRTALPGDYVTALRAAGGALFAGSRDIARIDPKTGEVQAKLQAHTGWVNALVDAGEGRLLSAADDGKVLLWQGDSATTLFDHEGYALSLGLSPDGAVAGFSDGTVRLIPLDARAPIVSHIHDDWVTDLVVTAEGTVMSGSRDRNVVVHTPGQGPLIVVYEGHRAGVRRVAQGPNGTLVSLGDEGDVYVWDLERDAIAARLNRSSHAPLDEVVAVVGPEVGVIEVANGFRYPVEIRVAGVPRGRVDGGKQLRIENLPVPAASPCEDDDSCVAGQYCDYEQLDPVCATRARVDAYVVGTEVRAWSGEAFLAENKPVIVRVPADEPFSVPGVADAPIDPRTSVGDFTKAWPDAAVVSAVHEIIGDDPEQFITPATAERIGASLRNVDGAPTEAVQFLTSHAQFKLTPIQLPVQPYRLREADYHLMRPPNPVARAAVLNDARDTTIITVNVHQDDLDKALDRLINVRAAIEALLAEMSQETGYRFHLTGDIIQDTDFVNYAQRDIQRLLPLFLLVVTLLLFVIYRRLSGVLLPLGLVGIAVMFAMGASAHLGAALNNMTVVVPQIVLASCIGDAVHIFNSYADRARAGMSSEQAAIESTVSNFAPCFWTTVSTSIGFFSLSTSQILPVGTFGWMAGIGVCTAFGMCFTILPGFMALLPAPKAERKLDTWIDDRLTALARYVNRSGGTVLFFGAIMAAGMLYGFTKISFDSNAILFFSKESPFRVACEFIEEHISGPNGLKIIVETNEPGGIRKVEYLQEIEQLRDQIAQTPEAVSIASLSDIQKSMTRVMNADTNDNYRLPRNDGDASSYYNAYSFSLRAGMELNNRVNADESSTLVDVRFQNKSSGWTLDWATALEDWAAQNLTKVKLTITGKTWLFANMLKEIAAGFFENVGSAVLLISVLMLFLAGSLRLGIAACIANILPLATTVGMLSLVGTTLDLSIMVSCCVAMGIIVDDTIHFVTKYRRLRAKGESHDDAIIGTVLEAGKAMIFTTIVLVAGVGLFIFTDFATNRNFGITVSIMLTVGVLFDLFMLPPLIKLLDKQA